MGYLIREAEEGDAEAIERLAKMCPPLRASVKGTYEYLVLGFKKYFLVVTRNDEIVGFVVGFPSLEGGTWIYQIAVHPEQRRKKVGEMLLQEELERLKSDGHDVVKTRVLKSNDPSMKLLGKFGFKKEREVGEWAEMEKFLR